MKLLDFIWRINLVLCLKMNLDDFQFIKAVKISLLYCVESALLNLNIQTFSKKERSDDAVLMNNQLILDYSIWLNKQELVC